MPKSIDWRYHRLNCISCAKAEEFLTQAGIPTTEQINARKVGIERVAALEMLGKITTLYVVRGKKVYEFDLSKQRPSNDELSELIIGRSGTLRAPSLLFGTTFVVGFEEQLYQRLLGQN